ncbi:MAG: alpha/beta hydrolase [Clostridia bacterium]|nr:alpha/beta hydrolase [Clostridia bacterium]
MEIKLWENNIPYYLDGADTPNMMTTYFIDTDKPLPCIVIYPGGGYHNLAAHEGAPYAEFFNKRGMHAVVVHYRIDPNRDPAPLADAQRAIKIVRANADKWMIDPDKIVTMGSSAGGHLAACTITLPDVCKEPQDDIDKQSCKPNGAILCYPVISVIDSFAHTGSGHHLLGEDRYEREGTYFSLQNRVTAETPKVFIWHTSDDECVNVKNSLVFGEKLRDNGIPFEMHIYPHGRHGLGLALDREDIRPWADLAADWVERNI